ncbi:hypothetical protein OAV46_00715 [Euryarchaeota archaeon]|nr:hypothetical protein [Euryarchaeota archaeon]MDC0327735.1 hypothetical protein [bacterium]MDC3246851.1 hypothetical protein [Euryarchaeota archaeon]MDC3281539.1 hypothetical protein [Euryarchaeota archaeon]
MAQTDWNEALTKPSSMISITALLLGLWVIILSIVNIVEGAYSPGYKVTWLSFLGFTEGANFVANDTGFIIDDAVFAIFGIILIGAGDYGMKKANTLVNGGNESSEGAISWILGLPNSYFMNNLIRGEGVKQTMSSWLVVIGILFYIVWSIQNNTWVDPGVYSVMISLVAFGFALNISSKAEG